MLAEVADKLIKQEKGQEKWRQSLTKSASDLKNGKFR